MFTIYLMNQAHCDYYTNHTQQNSSQEQVRMLISRATGKSCQLDPIPTLIVLKLLDVLLPVITKLINLSFDTGRFAEAWKEALVLPSLKKKKIPVSNLSYISKLSDRAGAEQFMEHDCQQFTFSASISV